MKIFRFYIVILFCFVAFAGKSPWTQVSSEEREIQQIRVHIASIKEQFTAMGATLSCSGVQNQIFTYLKNLGTKASFKVCKELIEEGLLSRSYLNQM